MRMLLENPSTYVAFGASTMSEIEFLRAVAQRTGCGLLLDVNNVHVSAVNHGFDAAAYIDAFPIQHVGEFHLAGFAEDRDSAGARLLIDDHGRPVARRSGISIGGRWRAVVHCADADRVGQQRSAVCRRLRPRSSERAHLMAAQPNAPP